MNSKSTISLGIDMATGTAIKADIQETGHLAVIGGTGSGKTTFILRLINEIFNIKMNVLLYVGDFKKSGDYNGLTDKFAEYDDLIELVREFYQEFQLTQEKNSEIKILLLDEYAGFIVWLTQKDKSLSCEMKDKMSEVLMLGRARNCYCWTIQQRMSATLFPAGIGAIDNYQILVGLGRLSVESRKSLFAGEHLANFELEQQLHLKKGCGLCLVDGQPLKAIATPWISDIELLKALLRKKAKLKG